MAKLDIGFIKAGAQIRSPFPISPTPPPSQPTALITSPSISPLSAWYYFLIECGVNFISSKKIRKRLNIDSDSCSSRFACYKPKTFSEVLSNWRYKKVLENWNSINEEGKQLLNKYSTAFSLVYSQSRLFMLVRGSNVSA